MRLNHLRRGAGEPLLLVHGIGDSHLMWSRVLGRLARAHECYAIDLPGFGRSQPLDGHPTVQRLAHACVEFMGELGHDDFHVAGNSMGGAITLELARMDRARSATALSPSGFSEGWDHAYKLASLRATRAVARALAPVIDTLSRSALMRRVIAGQAVLHGERYRPEELAATLRGLAAAPSFGAMLRGLDEYRCEPATFACPVTVAWGAHDYLLLTRPHSARARERLPAAHHVILHGCGHIPTWDDPEQVAKVILETTRSPAPQPRAAAGAPASQPR